MKNNKLSEKELDNLLSQSFLDLDFNQPKNAKLLESVADYSLNPKNSSLTNFGKSPLTKIILLLGTIAIGLGSILLLNNNKTPETKTSIVPTSTIEKNDTDKIIIQEVALEEKKVNDRPYVDKEVNQVAAYIPSESNDKEDTLTEVVIYKEVVTSKDEGKENIQFAIPKLSEKEIKETVKEKKKMGKLAAKLGKERYALIPGKNFYMQTAEVTNLEYRTFLFDLLIQGRNEDFIKAKPEQKLWQNATGVSKFDCYKDLYFSDARFNFFPVVNISQEGAEMYCKWLSELTNTYKSKNKTTWLCNFRLPEEGEWIYAAKAGKSNATYPWGRDSIQNLKNCFLANFCVQKLKEQFNQPIVYPQKINLNAYTSAGLALCSDTVATVNVYSYNPNNYYLYCMSGNVSEMVYINGSKSIKTKGGNWTSDFMHLKIESEDEFKQPIKPSPMIGFRVVVNSEN